MRVSQFIDLAQYAKKTVDEAISAAWSFTNIAISNFTNSQHNHSNAANGGTISHANLTSIGSNSHAQIDTHIGASAAHGVSGAIVGTTDVQSLSNKTFTGLTIGDDADFHFPTTFAFVKDDFSGNSNNAGELTWSNIASGTGAAVANSSGDLNHPGVRRCSTGTTTTGYAGMNWRTAFNYPNGGDVNIWILRTSANSGVIIRAGMNDMTSSTDSIDGYYFEFDPSVSANWQMVAANSSNRTKTPTSVAVSAATWYKLEIKVNEANTAAQFYIDDVLVGTVSTNLPSGSGDFFGLGLVAQNSGGASANVDVDVDLMYWYNKNLTR